MSGTLSGWVQRLLGLDVPASGEGTIWSLEYTWRWAPWLTVVFVVAAVALIALLYRRERGSAGWKMRSALASIRLMLIGLVLLMLAEWVLSMKRTGLPYLVILIDDSASMRTTDSYEDSDTADQARELVSAAALNEATRLNLAKALLLRSDAELLGAIDQRYKVRLYAVSDEARLLPDSPPQRATSVSELTPSGGSTRLGEAVHGILNNLRGSPPAAILMLTDGITTDGEGLLEASDEARRRGVPLFAVGLGDDKPQRDLDLAEVVVDDVVFAGDVINFEATIRASGLSGQSVKLSLRERGGGPVLAETTLRIGQENERQKVLLPYRPEKDDTADYVDFDFTLQLDILPREINEKNNERSGRVRIYNQQIRVLLVQAYPNYEYRYLQEMLERDETIELHTVLQEADSRYGQLRQDSAPRLVFPVTREELFKYDVVIFGDVNPGLLNRSSMQHLRDFVIERGGGVIFVAGPRYTPLQYRGTPLEPLFPVNLATANAPPLQASIDAPYRMLPTELGITSPPMQIGDGLNDTAEKWSGLAELYWMLRAPDLKPAARALAVHPTETDANGQKLPLISIQYVGAGKVVFHATDETWRWRWRVGDLYFSRYWVQTIRYLSRAKLGQEGTVELTTDRREYRSGDPVRLRLRFMNEEQAPAADGDVKLLIERPGMQKRELSLSRSGIARGQFEGVLQDLPEGNYRARVIEPRLPSETFADFAIQPPPGEMERLRMNLAELQAAAKMTKGRFYRFTDVDELVDDLPRGRQVPIDSLPPEPLWNKWPLLLVFLSLLSTEWILRKRSGML